MGIQFKSENDENFGSVQSEIVSIDDDTQDDILISVVSIFGQYCQKC